METKIIGKTAKLQDSKGLIVGGVALAALAVWYFMSHKTATPPTTNPPTTPGIPEPAMSLIVLNSGSVVNVGSQLSFTFAGFQPNASVNVSVVGKGGLTAKANSIGGGTYGFKDNDTPGGYTLQAFDSYGHSATALFVVV
jgi:hypothetical protein